MKLLDVLVKEMKEWPEGAYSLGQAVGGQLHANDEEGFLLFHTQESYPTPQGKPFYTDDVTKDMWEDAKVKSKTLDSLQSKHKHAEMIALCAEFAQTMENPMSMFQYLDSDGWQDFDKGANIAFYNHREYRLKPKTKLINGVEIPNIGIDLSLTKERTDFYTPCIRSGELFIGMSHNKHNDCSRLSTLGLTYPYTEEGKQAAILHAKTMLGID